MCNHPSDLLLRWVSVGRSLVSEETIMTQRLELISTTLLCAVLSACSSDATHGVSGGSHLAIQAQALRDSDASTLSMQDDSGSEFSVSAASVHLRDIELDLEDVSCADVERSLLGATCSDDQDGDGVTITIEGPFDVDLVAGTSTPSLNKVIIPTGSYRRIDFRADDNANDETFKVEASFDLDGLPSQLSLSLDFTEDIRFESDAGIVVTQGTNLIAQLIVDGWLSGVNIASCVNDGDVTVQDDRVVVSDDSSSGSCSDIENVIKDNMKNSGQISHE